MLIDDLTCLLSAEQVVSLAHPHTTRSLSTRNEENAFRESFTWKSLWKNFNERFLHISNVEQREVMSFPPRLQASFSAAEHIRSRHQTVAVNGRRNDCGWKLLKALWTERSFWWNTDSRIFDTLLHCETPSFSIIIATHIGRVNPGGFMQKSHPFSRNSFHNIEVRHDDWTR